MKIMFQEKNSSYVTTSIIQSLGESRSDINSITILILYFFPGNHSFHPSFLFLPVGLEKKTNTKPIYLKLVPPFEPTESLVLHVRRKRIQNC